MTETETRQIESLTDRLYDDLRTAMVDNGMSYTDAVAAIDAGWTASAQRKGWSVNEIAAMRVFIYEALSALIQTAIDMKDARAEIDSDAFDIDNDRFGAQD